jgi:hypothetical protein
MLVQVYVKLVQVYVKESTINSSPAMLRTRVPSSNAEAKVPVDRTQVRLMFLRVISVAEVNVASYSKAFFVDSRTSFSILTFFSLISYPLTLIGVGVSTMPP